jgi:hypothetical protein
LEKGGIVTIAKSGADMFPRLEAESAAQYERFLYYVSIGNERTLSKVAQKYLVSETLIRQISAEHQWRERLAAPFIAQYQTQVSWLMADAALATNRFAEIRDQLLTETWKTPALRLKAMQVALQFHKAIHGEPKIREEVGPKTITIVSEEDFVAKILEKK